MPATENSLMGEIVAQNNMLKGPPCSFVQIIASLSAADRADLAKAFENPDIRNSAIRRALVARGFQVSDHTVGRHRRMECLCGSE